MIDLLGLNYGTVKDNRICYLSPILNRCFLGIKEDVYQFVTAYQMCTGNKKIRCHSQAEDA
jgi:hypothetical protein